MLTDNSFLGDKVALRAAHLPPDPVRVLDCFGGKGLVWEAVRRKTGRQIDRLAIDTRQDDIGFRLPGDNKRWLGDLDLSRWNVIDLDAYGVPFDHLEIIFRRNFKGTIFATFIQSIEGLMPFDLLEAIGFTKQQINKAPTLFAHRGWQYFREYLALRGVRTICHRSRGRKHYLCFTLGASPDPPSGQTADRVCSAVRKLELQTAASR